MADSLDRWLDHALAEYSDASAPLGFEARTIARLREETPRQTWRWTTAAAFAAAVAVAVFTLPRLRVEEMKVPPPIATKIRVPALEKTRMAMAERRPRAARVKVDSMRGVPIVATPLTAQEQALLRVVRNARAKQYAGLVSRPRDLSKEVDPLEFKQMEIPALGKEEKQ